MRRVMLTSPQPPGYAQGNHEQMRLAPDRADGEGPIAVLRDAARRDVARLAVAQRPDAEVGGGVRRSEEHTSELQSRLHLVCRLLLEKKKTTRRCRVVA